MLVCSGKYANLGLLVLRIGLGVMFVLHGYPKLMGGLAQWTQLGMAMKNVGINSFPAFWGFMASLSEFLGGAFLIVGFMTRAAAAFLSFTMAVAVLFHLKSGAGLMAASHPLESCIVFLSLLLIGPGSYSLDALFCRSQRG